MSDSINELIRGSSNVDEDIPPKKQRDAGMQLPVLRSAGWPRFVIRPNLGFWRAPARGSEKVSRFEQAKKQHHDGMRTDIVGFPVEPCRPTRHNCPVNHVCLTAPGSQNSKTCVRHAGLNVAFPGPRARVSDKPHGVHKNAGLKLRSLTNTPSRRHNRNIDQGPIKQSSTPETLIALRSTFESGGDYP